MFRSDALRRIGLLDRDFFAYYEDVDWCLRAKAADERLLCVPAAVVRSLGVTVSTVDRGPAARPLEMYGQLVLDTDHLVRIRPRFQAEVVRIGRLSDQDPGWSASTSASCFIRSALCNTPSSELSGTFTGTRTRTGAARSLPLRGVSS